MRDIILNDCNIKNTLFINSNLTVAIDNNNSNFKLNYFGNAPILQQQLIELNDRFINPIEITSSAMIRLQDDCLCEKIIINSSDVSSVYFIGDITKIKILEIKSPCYIYTNTTPINSQMLNPTVNIDIHNNFVNSFVSLYGNLCKSNIVLYSYTTLWLDGKFHILTILCNPTPIPVNLSLNTFIKNIYIETLTLITASKDIFDKLKNPNLTPGIGHDKLVLNKQSYKATFTNGIGNIITRISEPGEYSICVSLNLDNKDILIDSKDITII